MCSGYCALTELVVKTQGHVVPVLRYLTRPVRMYGAALNTFLVTGRTTSPNTPLS